MKLTFDILRRANKLRDPEFRNGQEPVSLTFRGNELAGETGEACNFIKKLERARLGMKGSTATPQDLAKELADIVVCVDLIAMDLKIDLGKTIKDKFNETSRKYGLSIEIDQ
jgi:NTP pyrophosphatase (non-canonical NTP hydrolase)